MSGTTSGAVKATMETLRLGMPVYRDGAPADASAPYATIQEGIGYVAEQHGDIGDPTADMGVEELVQVDLYLPARAATATPGVTRNAESTTIPDVVHRGLHGAALPSVGTGRVYGCIVQSRQRWPIADNVARHTFTLRVRRSVQ